MTTAVDRVVLDTNVLLAATDESRAGHREARGVLDDWPARGTTLYTSGQILREYLVVATRPVEQNGLGMLPGDALRNVRGLRSRLRFLEETEKVTERLLELLAETACSGKQVHDASVVATMLTHGITALATGNAGHFERFSKHIDLVDLRGD